MGSSDAPTVFGARNTGTVTSFDVDVGLGDVENSAGQHWVFHCTQIAGRSRVIDPGSKVTFVIRAGAPGRWEAHDIQMV